MAPYHILHGGSDIQVVCWDPPKCHLDSKSGLGLQAEFAGLKPAACIQDMDFVPRVDCVHLAECVSEKLDYLTMIAHKFEYAHKVAFGHNRLCAHSFALSLVWA